MTKKKTIKAWEIKFGEKRQLYIGTEPPKVTEVDMPSNGLEVSYMVIDEVAS
jgi:hypothetical protein